MCGHHVYGVDSAGLAQTCAPLCVASEELDGPMKGTLDFDLVQALEQIERKVPTV